MTTKHKRAQMNLSSFLIAILVFSGIIGGVILLVNQMNVESPMYNISGMSSYDKSRATIEKINKISQQARSNDTGVLETVGFFTKGSLAAASTVLDGVGLISSTFWSIADSYGIPSLFIGIAVAVILLIIAMVIISAIFRYPL